MTMRDPFQEWLDKHAHNDWHADIGLPIIEKMLKAAYRAGQESMRESAARLPEVAYAASADEQRRLHTLAKQIRALPIDHA